jgi:membrane associated rhomboid family serine protease
MIPLKDDVPGRTVPFVTVALIALNVLAFLYQISLGIDTRGPGAGAAEALVSEFGVTPCRLTGSCPAGLARAAGDFPHPWATIVTSMFLHGGLFHVVGNMLYLWIFGNNVEDTLGHGRFLLFYLASGVAAAVGQTLVSPASAIPMIGASGAVSGVLGAYLLLFPYATILTLLTFGFFVRFVHVPAMIVLGFWIVVQLLNGYITFSARSLGRGESGGVAWFAHIGGFLAGMVLLFLLRPRRNSRL